MVGDKEAPPTPMPTARLTTNGALGGGRATQEFNSTLRLVLFTVKEPCYAIFSFKLDMITQR
jgi:hypothetical protein